jgi:response regulator RpfG family c-di-GMP phosphodiesterase
MMDTTQAVPRRQPATLLCVDDEPSILSALRRLFRASYHVLTADSAAAALQLLEHESVDVVLSDMRMPEMDGAEFLAQVRRRNPDTVRLMMTGYADVASIMAAINGGEIYRYVTKPWRDSDIVLAVRHAFERLALQQERDRLAALTQQQNAALNALNHSLESKVEARTRDLAKSHDAMVVLNQRLKDNFITTVKILSGMIEMRGGLLSGHARRVADLARRIAQRMTLDSRQVQDVFVAALLHDIGKAGLHDDLLDRPLNMLSGDTLGRFRQHPLQAEQLLMPLADLREVAAIVRAQLERYDGEGFPDGSAGDAIPLGARILALASDYDNLQLGALVQRRLPADEAGRVICASAGRRYDPAVVAAFRAITEGEPVSVPADMALLSGDLVPGMTLSRDLVSRDGLLLLTAEQVLDARMIRQVMEFETKSRARLGIRVWPQPAAVAAVAASAQSA